MDVMDVKDAGGVTLRLGYRAPYRFEELLRFFGARAIAGVEAVYGGAYVRTVRIAADDGSGVFGWVRVEDDPCASELVVTASESLRGVMPELALRICRQFDTENDPMEVFDGLASMAEVVPGCPQLGTRLPGSFDPFETTCRAIIGQQVTVKAASSIAGRIARALGTAVDTGIEGLDRAWPTPSEVLSIEDPEAAFGNLGLIRSRTRSILEIARLFDEGELTLDSRSSADEQTRRLLSVKGIGPWTAGYVAMRVLGCSDAFLESDAGVAHALPDLTPKERLALSERWRPYRSYAVISLWNSLDG